MLPTPIGVALHRIVQEGLTNAHRHSPGAAVLVCFGKPASDELFIEVTNRPSIQSSLGPGTGRGLPGLGERVRWLGGTLEAKPTTEGGYRLAVSLPLTTQGADDD